MAPGLPQQGLHGGQQLDGVVLAASTRSVTLDHPAVLREADACIPGRRVD